MRLTLPITHTSNCKTDAALVKNHTPKLPGRSQPPNEDRMAQRALIAGLIGLPIIPTIMGALALLETRGKECSDQYRREALGGIFLGLFNLVLLLVLVFLLLPWAWSNISDAIQLMSTG